MSVPSTTTLRLFAVLLAARQAWGHATTRNCKLGASCLANTVTVATQDPQSIAIDAAGSIVRVFIFCVPRTCTTSLQLGRSTETRPNFSARTCFSAGLRAPRQSLLAMLAVCRVNAANSRACKAISAGSKLWEVFTR